jgi:hypothetical protein
MDALNVISLDKARKFLKVDFIDADTDEEITDAIKSAVDFVEKQTNYRLYQRNEVIVNDMAELQLFQYPINSITIVDQNDVAVDKSTYRVDRWPIRTLIKFYNMCNRHIYTLADDGELYNKITLDVGFTDTTQIPQSILSAVKQLVTFFYENRNETSIDKPNNIMVTLQQYNRAPLI